MDSDDDFAMSLLGSESDDLESIETISHPKPALSPAALPGEAIPSVTMLLKGKGKEWDEVAKRPGPLTLLELPVDILRLIVKEIMHANDLTSLALTNSTLHSIAIPYIYARFDIVWPIANHSVLDHKSIDALTYGLSTLSLGSSFSRIRQRLFLQGPPQKIRPPFDQNGNNYAAHTRKFSLGNGHGDLISTYMINKESGKMLGTLVAMAVAKMINLETFVWDMPTGVIAEIFLALASLPDHHASGECNLDSVWVRWHDNSPAHCLPASSPSSPTAYAHPQMPPNATMTPVGIQIPPSHAHPKPKPAFPYSSSLVEYPTFSVLPPLKSLTVLDIDELAYLDEISMLIERSKESLQELRIGVAKRVQNHDFVLAWDGPELQQVDHNARWPGASTISERRLGGVLGILVGRIYDIRRKPDAQPHGKTEATPKIIAMSDGGDDDTQEPSPVLPGSVSSAMEILGESHPPSEAQPMLSTTDSDKDLLQIRDSQKEYKTEKTTGSTTNGVKPSEKVPERKRLEGRLRLKTLELERVALSIQVCSRAFDWKLLTSLTILDCAHHETLWRLLRRQFQPTPVTDGYGFSPSSGRPAHLQYHLNLKCIHANNTTTSLVSFLKETLAPNTLEELFLQDQHKVSSQTSVSIDAIFKGPLKRHRSSLRKLLLDSSAQLVTARWQNWVLTTEMVHYITSGRMINLKELAVSMAHRDWHTFLQRLPNLSQLRSLYIPNVADPIIGSFDPNELALQIVDIITLRPEIQLCYVGILKKCFEILESAPGDRGGDTSSGSSGSGNNNGVPHSPAASFIIHEFGDDNDTSEDGDANDSDEDVLGEQMQTGDSDEMHSDGHLEDVWDSDDEGFVDPDNSPAKTRLRLREILFYDDKVAIFKARHGCL